MIQKWVENGFDFKVAKFAKLYIIEVGIQKVLLYMLHYVGYETLNHAELSGWRPKTHPSVE